MEKIIINTPKGYKAYDKVEMLGFRKPITAKLYEPQPKSAKTDSYTPKASLLKQHVNYMKFHKGNKVEQALFGAKLAIANHLADNTFGSVVDKANTPKPSYKLKSKFKKDELLEDDVCKSQK